MDNQEITVFENCPKLKELIEIIEEADGKFIIWANYVHNIESIVDTLKKTYGADSTVSIYGADNSRTKTRSC
jgi:ERCC4-related helicase